MDEDKTKKGINSAKLMLISIFIVVMFIVGTIFGGSLIYGLTSSELDDLNNQIDSLQHLNTPSI